jgi:hypothetical protein
MRGPLRYRQFSAAASTLSCIWDKDGGSSLPAACSLFVPRLDFAAPGLTVAQSLTVTLPGTGVSTLSAERFQAATLVEASENIPVIDAGRGARLGRWRLPELAQ